MKFNEFCNPRFSLFSILLIDTFLKAGEFALAIRKEGLKTEIKSDNTPVTNGDIGVNKLLTNNYY